MTETNLAANAISPHLAFWRNLKEGPDIFDTTRRPPSWDVCERRYAFGTDAVTGPSLDPNGSCPVGSLLTRAAAHL
jgi:murein L,D-transpeptidase YafK